MKHMPVALAAGRDEATFWDLAGALDGTVVQRIVAEQADEAVRSLEQDPIQPCAVIVSPQIATNGIRTLITRIKTITDAPVIVATAETNDELEREARSAGIFYYLVLPGERDRADQVLASAVQTYLQKHGEANECQT